MNQYLKYFLIYTLGLITPLIFLSKCDKEVSADPNYLTKIDSLNKINKELVNNAKVTQLIAEAYKHKADSLQALKSKIYPKYLTKRDTVIKYYRNDTLITSYVAYCDSMINYSDSIIVAQDSAIRNFRTTIQFKDSIIINREALIVANISELQSEQENQKHLKKELRRQKVKTVIVGVIGTLTTGLSAYFLLVK